MKVLLVPDKPGWAFDHRAKDLMGVKFDKITLSLKYQTEVKKVDLKFYDLIYAMSIPIAKILHRTCGIPYHRMATGITSLRVLEPQMMGNGRLKPAFISLLKNFGGINTGSTEIRDLVKGQLKVYKTRVGIHETMFTPGQRPRNKVFTIGWVGRIDRADYRAHKGYDLVVKALQGLDVKLLIRTYKEEYVPREQMVKFYQYLDLFICSSKSEHLPLPVLEAAACGVPIISTRVGIVPELIKPGVNGLLVSRNVVAIRKAVWQLMNNNTLRVKLSRNIRSTVLRDWTWEKCKLEWEQFFLSI